MQSKYAAIVLLVHYRGTLEPLGCCNNLLYERDEYVAIKNTSLLPQDIRGKVAGQTEAKPHYDYAENPPGSVASRFSNEKDIVILNIPDVDWSQCNPVDPLDETPMKAVVWEAGQPVPCILYSRQTILVFTDEIHRQYGGFTFKYGPGNIWDNNTAGTAALYNADSVEVSRHSYFRGK